MASIRFGLLLVAIAWVAACGKSSTADVTTTAVPLTTVATPDQIVALSASAAATTQTTGSSLPRVWLRPAATDEGPAATGAGLTALVEGELRYDDTNDCFLVDQGDVSYPIVWPAGTEPLTQGPGVRLRSGAVLAAGDFVTGGGGYLHVAADHGIPSACLPSTGEVAIFDPSG